MSKLFDENSEEYEDFLDETEDDTEIKPKSFVKDKIFDNNYNTGNLDFEEFGTLPKVDSIYAEENLKNCYDSFDYERNLKLEILVNSYFIETEIGKVFANKKKIPKQSMSQVFVSIREKFIKSDYTGTEIFTCIADYFRINYEVLYENIPSVYREELVRELDEKYNVLSKKGVKRLF